MSDRTCSVDGCERVHQARGWCAIHYTRWRVHGDPHHVEPRMLNRENLDVHGYRRIKVPGHPMAVDRGWALEHRVVAWDHFGPFDPALIVHHLNHDKLDNRPENLAIMSQSEHCYDHDFGSIRKRVR